MREREGDSGFVQRTRHADGSMTHRLPEGEQGDQAARMLEERRSAFVERFGREPSPGDPVFFDTTARGSKPRAITEQSFREALSRPGVAEQLGIEPAVAAAVAELGYVVSEANQHLFSAEEVRAFDSVVERHRGGGR